MSNRLPSQQNSPEGGVEEFQKRQEAWIPLCFGRKHLKKNVLSSTPELTDAKIWDSENLLHSQDICLPTIKRYTHTS